MPSEVEVGLRIGIPLLILLIGLFSGTWFERRHYASIERRERALRPVPVTNLKSLDPTREVVSSRLVGGSVVVSVDAYKALVGSLQSFFGGRVTTYERLVDRARREAVLRLFDEAGNADTLVNLRVETSMIAEPGESASSVEAFAYATAVEYRS